jgi:outer membrane phospholipase A
MRQILKILLLALPASAASAEAVLSVAETRPAAGEPLEIVITITNDDATPLVVELPDRLHFRVETASSVATVEFTPDRTGALAIAPSGFAKVRVRGSLPAGLAGQATLTSTGLSANPLLLHVDQAPATSPVRAASTDVGRRQNESHLVDKPPPLTVSAYEPVYFIVGGDGGLNAKFQISLRYQLFDGNGRLATRLPWIDDFYVSFSQTSLWDLSEESKPFTDSSYRPRLFFADYNLTSLLDGQLRVGVETGFGHESNGKEGEDSRSFNMAYVRPTLTFGDPEGLRFYLAPLIHNYIADDDNPDLEDYRGYVDWLFGLGSKGGLDFWATLRKGERSNFGSAELNFSYPLSKLSGGDLSGWLTLQYFGGYGESLIHYREKLDSQLRFGIAIAL